MSDKKPKDIVIDLISLPRSEINEVLKIIREANKASRKAAKRAEKAAKLASSIRHDMDFYHMCYDRIHERLFKGMNFDHDNEI